MGAGQSQPAESKSIYITEEDVPEAYRTVGVSEEVVNAVNQAQNRTGKVVIEAATDPELAKELERQRNENRRLREEMLRLSQLQSRQISVNPADSRADIEEKKKVFEETVDRVKQQFFGYQKENACSDVEKQLLRCLQHNKSKILNCEGLRFDLDKCVAEVRNVVLKGA
ncbi:unnamed protein product [Bursaphelenchus xylophilus]|uniref:(pine wood nematode) hypothetical protein n=1 Tax=Bursaphelenchus xylophilus TaxID=6326 RepID=A0A1I7S2R8_BURXY|nr:unnamed protein product [Bursaphelenchus xylophilus]CAG9121686.1 unnamed protein product [Bursaphelenchus xylophilus]